MGPGVITSRTLAPMTGSASSVRGYACLSSALPGPAALKLRATKLRAAEQAVEGTADLLGQGGVGTGTARGGMRRGHQAEIQHRLRLADQAAVQDCGLVRE